MEITKADIENLIRERMESLILADEVAEALQPFEGKQISKRLATAVEKALGNKTVYYDKQAGMFHLAIWGDGIDYRNRKSFLLGYQYGHDGIFRMEEYLERNACHYGAAHERNEKRREILAKHDEWMELVARTITTINRERKALEALLGEKACPVGWDLPDKYAIEDLVVKP